MHEHVRTHTHTHTHTHNHTTYPPCVLEANMFSYPKQFSKHLLYISYVGSLGLVTFPSHLHLPYYLRQALRAVPQKCSKPSQF
jgi:hypothetical protein